MDKETLSAAFAKAKLLGLTDGEVYLLEYLLGISGSFRQGLYDLFSKADFQNKRRLIEAFPYLEEMDLYMNEPGWFEEKLKKDAEKIGISF